MKYTYTCVNPNCNGEQLLDQPMEKLLPDVLTCPMCGKESLKHKIEFPSAIHVPEGFGSTNNKISYDKSPSRGKHFW